jgi:hypothetical protein
LNQIRYPRAASLSSSWLVGQYSVDEPLITGRLRPLRRETAEDEISA